MSSDTYQIEIQAITGATVELLCTTGTAAGLNDLSCTRSFALMVIADGLPYAKTLPLQHALARASHWP